MNLDAFYEYVDLEKPVLKKKITECMKGFLMSLETIRERSTTEVEDAYLVKAMLPVYAKVRLIKGRSMINSLFFLHGLTIFQAGRIRPWRGPRSAGQSSAISSSRRR